ncbi:MAG: carboxypeptidase-like regulatory domain-containing protein [Vicinamibacterales bacterium]
MPAQVNPLRLLVIVALTAAVGVKVLFVLRGPAGPSATPAKPEGAAVITGLVADDEGRPLAGAAVHARTDGAQFQTRSDAAGRFEFAGLPAAVFDVRAGGTQLAGRYVGPTGSDVAIVDLAARDRAEVRLRQPRPGMISGRLVGPDGRPWTSGYVRLLSRVAQADQILYVQKGDLAGPDGNGRFSLSGVPPGRYYLAAGFDADGHWMAYYPDARTLGEARPVDVGIAGRVEGLELRARPRRLGRGAGTVRGTDGRPLAGVEVRLSEIGPRHPDGVSIATETDEQGRFAIDAAPVGRYWLAASLRGTGTAFVPLTIRMSAQPASADLVLEPPARIAGRLRVPADPQRSSSTQSSSTDSLSIGLWAVDGAARATTAGIRPARVAATDGPFTIEAPPGRYRLVVTARSPWLLRKWTSARLDADGILEIGPGEVVDDVTVEIVGQASAIAGVVRDAGGHAVPFATVTAEGDDSGTWSPGGDVVMTRADSLGRFSLAPLRPIRYRVVAGEPGERGRLVALEPGQHREIDLRLADGPDRQGKR